MDKIDIRTYNVPLGNDFAVIIPSKDNSFKNPRELIIKRQNGSLTRIMHTYSVFDPMSYPLLFPKGSLSWSLNLNFELKKHKNKQYEFVDITNLYLDSSIESESLINTHDVQQLDCLTDDSVYDEYNNDENSKIFYENINDNIMVNETSIINHSQKFDDDSSSLNSLNTEYSNNSENNDFQENESNHMNSTITLLMFLNFILQIRKSSFNILFKAGKLLHQFVTLKWIDIETSRLNYCFFNQNKFRVDMYKGLIDAHAQLKLAKDIGKQNILPSSYIGKFFDYN